MNSRLTSPMSSSSTSSSAVLTGDTGAGEGVGDLDFCLGESTGDRVGEREPDATGAGAAEIAVVGSGESGNKSSPSPPSDMMGAVQAVEMGVEILAIRHL